MKNVYIYGAGGFGREVFCWLQEVQKQTGEINFVGFLDDASDASVFPGLKELYLGKGDDWKPGENDYVVVAVGMVDMKVAICDRLKNNGAQFFNLIHPSAIIGSDVVIGEGNIICPNCVLTTNISIGDYNHINVATTIGHDVVIGSYNTFSSHNDITGAVTVGDNNFFGSSVVVAPNKKVGSNNKISAGSIIFRNIKDNMLVMGNPAKSYK